MILKIAAGIATLAVIGFGVVMLTPKDYSGKSNREVADMCIQHTNLALHIHPTLEIVVGGEKQVLPANIGITASCMRPLHTHDATGVLHIESPDVRDFTLGDFLYVWGKPFNAEKLVKMTVNGVEVMTGESTVLKDHDALVLTYSE